MADTETVGTETEEVTETTQTSETKTLTADEIDKMVARAADRASRKAAKDLAAELGFDEIGKLKEWAKTQRTKETEEESELERQLREAQTEKTRAAEERNTLRAERLNLAIARQILGAKVTDPKRSERISTIIKAELPPDLDETDWEATITETIEAVQKDTPELFGKPGGYGSGDGGAGGGTDIDDTEKQDETWRKEYAARGLVTGPTL